MQRWFPSTLVAPPVGCFHPTCAHPLAHTSTRWVSPGMQQQQSQRLSRCTSFSQNPSVIHHVKHLPKKIWNTREIMQKNRSLWKTNVKKTPKIWNHPQKKAHMASWCAATPCGLDSAMYGGFSKDPMGCANREKSAEGDMILDEQLSHYFLETLPLKFKATLLKRQIMLFFELWKWKWPNP